MDVHQFATSLVYGDAISDEMLEIRSVLRDNGFRSEIFVKMFDPRSAQYVRDYREYKRFSAPDNVVIFHFSIGSPVSKLFFRVPDRKMMIYHNITPHEYFIDAHRILARDIPREQFLKMIETGRTDLLDRFWSLRTRRPFSAYLVLKEDLTTGFEFAPRAPKAKKAPMAKPREGGAAGSAAPG
jgi:hypothetical protein